MGDRNVELAAKRARRRERVRKPLRGSGGRPRLSVYRSHKHVAVQLIDDLHGMTLAHASTYEAELRGKVGDGVRKLDEAKKVGETIARRALEKGVKRVVFDRGPFAYHGRVKALAEAARAAGLEF